MIMNVDTFDVATRDVPSLLVDLNYKADIIVTFLLLGAGVVSAALVCFLFYRFIIRFF